MIDEKTPNRQYTLPNPQNAVSEDVYRLITALQGIDIDVANLISALADKAAGDHTHPLAKINGLVDALAAKQDTSARGAPNGYAALDASGKISENNLPALAIADVFEAASQAAMLALTAENGDVCVRSDLNKSFILKTRPASLIANWVELRTPTNAVLSVLGLTGAISRDDLRTKLELGSAAFAAVGDFATAVQFAALQLALDDKLPKSGKAANSALLNGKTEDGLVASGPVADAIAAAGNGIGTGQTWQAVTRTSNTVYQNTTGKPIYVAGFARTSAAVGQNDVRVSNNGSTWLSVLETTIGSSSNPSGVAVSFIVPNGGYYLFYGSAYTVRELR